MSLRLKHLRDQIIVITGASSGIGLVTARMAAKRGARLVLAARSQDALMQLEQELSDRYRTVVAVVADVGRPEDVQRVSRVARQRFGGFDTWINNAGVSIYGRLLDQPIEDMRRLFDTNFWGVVYGSLEAARHFQSRGEAGAIINIGSAFSDRAMPLQGMYSASKHAVKGFTDALRMELERQGLPVAVTLVKPSAIATPYPQHAKNFLEEEPTNPPPIYAPELVAKTILHCAEHPERDMFVGAAGKVMSVMGKYAPRLGDFVTERLFAGRQRTGRPPRPCEQHGLSHPSGRLRERGRYRNHIFETSLYTQGALHPVLAGAALVGTGLVISALYQSSQERHAGGQAERHHTMS
ncbi:MAG TPA: SDR family oxidoreductase [Nitrospiraceae bacterium]|nr:SDR family oxidoreductase [Nitrospiraceae bacterium]